MESLSQNPGEQVAKDPVCGMTVDPHNAAGSFEFNGQTYFFCRPGCLDKFRTDPKNFLSIHLNSDRDTTPTRNGSGESRIHLPDAPGGARAETASCPKCGMALEPLTATLPEEKIEYTCPMHPQIVRDAPGNCPICGMTLEPRVVTGEEENAELIDMKRRFWVTTALTLPLLLLAMSEFIPGDPVRSLFAPRVVTWISLALASPVVLWGGWPFFVRAWQSIVNRSLNMFTLIGLGVAVAYVYSVIAALLPQIFPASFRDEMGNVPGLFRSRGGDHHARSAWSGAGAEGPQRDQCGDQSAAGSGAENGATNCLGWKRTGCTA